MLLFILCVVSGVGDAIDVAANVSESAKAGTEVWSSKDYRNCSLSGGPEGAITEKYFWLDIHDDTISLALEKPLDFEVLVSENVFSTTTMVVTVHLKCDRTYSSKDEIIVSVHVEPVNEFRPVFLQSPYEVEIQEGTPKGSTLFTLRDKVQDRDAFKFNNIVSFDVNPYLLNALDGRPYFSVDNETGDITTDTEIDYEVFERHNYVLNITATDDGGLVSFPTSLRINITDVDDMAPLFYDPRHPGCRINCSTLIYSRVIDIHFQGDLEDVTPYRVLARDGDRGVNAKMNYSLEYDTGDEMESNLFIDDDTGILQVILPYDNFTNVTSGQMDDPFFVTVTIVATELDTNRRSVNASFTLTVYRVLPTPPPPTTPTTTSTKKPTTTISISTSSTLITKPSILSMDTTTTNPTDRATVILVTAAVIGLVVGICIFLVYYLSRKGTWMKYNKNTETDNKDPKPEEPQELEHAYVNAGMNINELPESNEHSYTDIRMTSPETRHSYINLGVTSRQTGHPYTNLGVTSQETGHPYTDLGMTSRNTGNPLTDVCPESTEHSYTDPGMTSPEIRHSYTDLGVTSQESDQINNTQIPAVTHAYVNDWNDKESSGYPCIDLEVTSQETGNLVTDLVVTSRDTVHSYTDAGVTSPQEPGQRATETDLWNSEEEHIYHTIQDIMPLD